jgi:hypothetical protein
MSMTFTSLSNQIMNYLDNADTNTVAIIPTFISNAEQKLARECKSEGFEQYVVGTFVIGNPVIPKPGRWLKNIAFNVGSTTDAATNRNIVEYRDYDYLRMYTPNPTTTQGLPKFYADYGFYNLLVAPTPDQAYYFEWAYLELLQPLTEQSQTNWLTNYAPDTLFYYCMIEAMTYLKNDERIAVWKQLGSEGLSSLVVQDESRIKDRGSDRAAD